MEVKTIVRKSENILKIHDIHNQALCKNFSLPSYQELKNLPGLAITLCLNECVT